MNDGWVKIHRKMTSWEWFRDSNMVHLFLYFLLLANHGERKWQGITVKKGQFITGLYSLHEATGISIQSLRTCVKRLKSTNEIEVIPTNRFSLITIVKYEDYQVGGGRLTNKNIKNQQTTNKQLTTNKNVKNDKKNILAKARQLSDNKKTMQKNKLGKYREDTSSDSYETVIDAETGESPVEEQSNILRNMNALLAWGENRRGGGFVNPPKQRVAMKKMRLAGIGPEDIKRRWIELEGQEFYKKVGMDFMSVCSSFDKKPLK
jgi:hypothetical protein